MHTTRRSTAVRVVSVVVLVVAALVVPAGVAVIALGGALAAGAPGVGPGPWPLLLAVVPVVITGAALVNAVAAFRGRITVDAAGLLTVRGVWRSRQVDLTRLFEVRHRTVRRARSGRRSRGHRYVPVVHPRDLEGGGVAIELDGWADVGELLALLHEAAARCGAAVIHEQGHRSPGQGVPQDRVGRPGGVGAGAGTGYYADHPQHQD